jgi:hypothetical protein
VAIKRLVVALTLFRGGLAALAARGFVLRGRPALFRIAAATGFLATVARLSRRAHPRRNSRLVVPRLAFVDQAIAVVDADVDECAIRLMDLMHFDGVGCLNRGAAEWAGKAINH